MMVTVLRLAFVLWMVSPFLRVLLGSTLGAPYRAYRKRAGMFVPRFGR
jgi:protein-S-isoprenylcysteine O-methyltransferase Ste14